MKMYLWILLTIFLIVGISCQNNNDIEADKQALIKITEDWDKNAMANNLKNLDFFTENAIRIDNGRIYEGKERISTLLKSYNEDYIVLTNVNKVEDIRISGDLATIRGSYAGSFIVKESGDTLQAKAAWVTVSERQTDGSWKTVIDIGSELKE